MTHDQTLFFSRCFKFRKTILIPLTWDAYPATAPTVESGREGALFFVSAPAPDGSKPTVLCNFGFPFYMFEVLQSAAPEYTRVTFIYSITTTLQLSSTQSNNSNDYITRPCRFAIAVMPL
jgi:hypothetical protein